MYVIRPLQPQTNYQQALAGGFDVVRGRGADSLAALGAKAKSSARWELPVLDDVFLLDLEDDSCTLVGGGDVRIEWRILALHYLAAEPLLAPSPKWLNFSELEPAARVYDKVYRGRVLGRLCSTVGRDRDTFVAACLRLGAEKAEWGDEGFRFQVFPLLPVIIAWYAGDGEFPAGASFLYPGNVTSFLPLEDVVVLSERVVSRLEGAGWR